MVVSHIMPNLTNKPPKFSELHYHLYITQVSLDHGLSRLKHDVSKLSRTSAMTLCIKFYKKWDILIKPTLTQELFHNMSDSYNVTISYS
jgi:hypothetical protein